MANGIPLNARTPDFKVTPETDPLLVFTRSGIAAMQAVQKARLRASDESTFIGAGPSTRKVYRIPPEGAGTTAQLRPSAKAASIFSVPPARELQ